MRWPIFYRAAFRLRPHAGELAARGRSDSRFSSASAPPGGPPIPTTITPANIWMRPTRPLFRFGHGLSYGDFGYSGSAGDAGHGGRERQLHGQRYADQSGRARGKRDRIPVHPRQSRLGHPAVAGTERLRPDRAGARRKRHGDISPCRRGICGFRGRTWNPCSSRARSKFWWARRPIARRLLSATVRLDLEGAGQAGRYQRQHQDQPRHRVDIFAAI